MLVHVGDDIYVNPNHVVAVYREADDYATRVVMVRDTLHTSWTEAEVVEALNGEEVKG